MRFLKVTLLNALLIGNYSIVAGHFESVPSTGPLAPVSLLLNQLDAPLEILDYSARYIEGANKGQQGHIEHQLTCQNVGDQAVVAVELTFLSFNLWNELFDRSKHTFVRALDSSEECEFKWPSQIEKDVDGSIFRTGVAYVSRLRFENGEIWSADLSEIAGVLEKVAPEISPSSL